MIIEMKKLVPVDGEHELYVCESKEDFIEVFGEFYEDCISSPEQNEAVKTYPEEMQDLLTEIFHTTSSTIFWNNPLSHFNRHTLNNYEFDKVWVMTKFEK